jgi:hypothetical protein
MNHRKLRIAWSVARGRGGGVAVCVVVAGLQRCMAEDKIHKRHLL